MTDSYDSRRGVFNSFTQIGTRLMLALSSVASLASCVEGMEAEDLDFADEATDTVDTVDTAFMEDQAATPAVETDALQGPLPTPVAISCSQNNDCNDACICSAGTCEPDGFGPPSSFCDLPPQRACSSAGDCQSSCVCGGGLCQPDGFGPSNPDCHMPPPDTYEYDDTWQNWSAYTGSPQTHNLHTASDQDWIAVYFGVAGTARFRTYGLALGSDTKIEVYTYTNGSKGALVGSNDDIGGAWWLADSKSSRVIFAVPANSSYVVRVVNRSPASIYTDSHEFPRYNLEIAYQ
jgi:hypothetical protein